MPLSEGMILSIEPGYYREGAFGIRLENLAVVRSAPDLPGGDAHRAMLSAPDEPVLFDPAVLDPFDSPWRPGGPAKPDQPHAPQARPGRIRNNPDIAADFSTQTAAFEMQLIDEALSLSQGHQGRAADLLGLSYHQFRGLLKKHDYGRNAGKPAAPETGTPPAAPVRSM